MQYTKPSEATAAIMLELQGSRTTHKSKYVEYYELPAAFDIETTSFRTADGSKAACMYVWQFALGSSVIIGRTWEEYEDFVRELQTLMGLSKDRRLVVYVHNLAFEFQFIRSHHAWEEVFATEEREPLYACTESGLEFRCSYRLSGLSLAKLGDNLRKPIPKMIGDLDYRLLRHSGTPLTDVELGYCAHDVQILIEYIRECMEDEGSIVNIPLTKTGYVRRHVRNLAIGSDPKHRTREQWKYVNLMKTLTIEPREYEVLKRAFQGGFTHANAWAAGKVYHNVASYDFTSSYPTVMISEQYPMSKGQRVTIKSRKELEYYCSNYCTMFDVSLRNLKTKTPDQYISTARCHADSIKGGVENNGRLVSADAAALTVTDVDWELIQQTYEFDPQIGIANCYIYKRGYLPKLFVRTILDLYKDKTELKGIPGKEQEYMVAKGMLNSMYGMCVTDICRENVTYDDDKGWDTEDDPNGENRTKAINKENGSYKRFLFYPWGVWVTAYARRALWSGILECGTDYLYSDTDSIKITNAERHAAYIEQYNADITSRLQAAMAYHGFDPSEIAPCSKDGKPHPLGVWDYEGTYDEFKTLGAKRYFTRTGDRYSLTVAGLGKKIACEYIAAQTDPFAFFKFGMEVPAEHTGKLTHTYIDKEIGGAITDYLGNAGYYHEYTCINLEPASYIMSLGQKYSEFLKEIGNDAI